MKTTATTKKVFLYYSITVLKYVENGEPARRIYVQGFERFKRAELQSEIDRELFEMCLNGYDVEVIHSGTTMAQNLDFVIGIWSVANTTVINTTKEGSNDVQH